MSFDFEDLSDAVCRYGSVARVVVADVRGSAPREIGAAMLVWQDGQSGTIGGGALEYEAVDRARAVLGGGKPRLDQCPLGPSLGQCCGGSVTLLTERWDTKTLGDLGEGPVARAASGSGSMPLTVSRVLKTARGEGIEIQPQLLAGWMIEPLTQRKR